MTDQKRQVVDRRKYVSEAFHSFHQPLTSLHCGLELALQKQRSEAEYRQRIEDALVSAGAVLRLNKALRELVDANDPGERFGTVLVAPLLAQLAEDLSVVADASMIRVAIGHVGEVHVAADPSKLLCALGNIMSSMIAELEPHSGVSVKLEYNDRELALRVVPKGKKRETSELPDMEQKLRDIRLDAAQCYIWTLQGEFTRTDKAIEIRLPVKS